MNRDVNEFSEMLKEAFVGEEPFDPQPARAALQGSIDKFDRRMRTVRHMAWFGVTFMGAVMVFAAVMFFRAPETASARGSPEESTKASSEYQPVNTRVA